jgi:hypothetical protein
MTDREFEILKLKIEAKMDELDDLQRIYNRETGVDFVRPLRLRRLDIKEAIKNLKGAK